MNHTLTTPHIAIPYIPAIRMLTGSTNAAILFQQLNFRFEKKPSGFYKFQSPPAQPHDKYRAGDSWTEELMFSKEEFRTAFDKIGVRYFTKTDYLNAANKFEKDGKEQFFCSYFDKIRQMTFYFKNTALINSALKKLGIDCAPKPAPLPLPKQEKPNLGIDNSDLPKSHNYSFDKLTNPIPNIETKNTTENTSKNNNKTAPQQIQPVHNVDLSPVVVVELEKTFSNSDLPASKKALATIPAPFHLQVLAVLILQLTKQAIPNKVGYLCRLVSNVKNGTFTPIAAVAVPISLDERIKQEKIKREEETKRGKIDNVSYFVDQVKRFGDKFIVPEAYRQAVFERLAV
jgi:hypothetical protein